MIRVIGIGAGGHARVIVEALQLRGEVEIVGLLDRSAPDGCRDISGVPILGDDTRLPALYASGVRHAFIGLGRTNREDRRRLLYEHVRSIGFDILNVVHPRAYVSPSARLGHGSTVLAGAVVNTAVRLGANVLVNSAAVIEHDCVIGEHTHVACGAILCGGVRTDEGSLIGAGAVVRQGIRIGTGALVAAGAVVVKDVPEGATVAGLPARRLADWLSGMKRASLRKSEGT